MKNWNIVELSTGRIRGELKDGLSVFKGVPYAEAGRWQVAEPHPGWTVTLDATAYGPSAPQPFMEGGDPVLGGHGAPPFAEECLTLNVWTPDPEATGLPVMVWIHGGGFISGSGSLPNYSGEAFARDGGMVVVTINYRLGALGYLDVGSSEEDPANFWFTDQLAALRWVKANIAAFGGDPGDITVAGQSGGAFSTAALAGHPDARGLFQRAILQSPPLGLVLPTRAESLKTTATLMEVLGCEDVKEMRALPWERLVGATFEMFGRTGRWGYWPTPFLPVLDKETLAKHPAELLLDAQAAGIEIMIGWTREEANFGFALNPMYASATREQVVARAADTFGEQAEKAYEAYAATRPGARPLDVLMDLISDDLFRIPAVRVAERRAAQGDPVWAYQFDYPGALGAAHCLELPFVFGNFDDWAHAPFLAGMDTRTRDGLGATMHRTWISFVTTGDPNNPALPAWERYTTEARTTMRFDTVTAPVSDLAGPWRRLHEQRAGD